MHAHINKAIHSMKQSTHQPIDNNVNQHVINQMYDNSNAEVLVQHDGIQLCINSMTERTHHYMYELYDNETATFIAEQLLAIVLNYCKHNNDNNTVHHNELICIAVYTLAQCHYNSHAVNRCYAVLDRYKQYYQRDTCTYADQNVYLLAHCAYQLQLYQQCEHILIGTTNTIDAVNDSMYEICNHSAGWLLLGKTCAATGRTDHAIQCYQRCVEIDSCNWAAYTALCQLGVNIDTSTIFNITINNINNISHRTDHAAHYNNTTQLPHKRTLLNGAPTTVIKNGAIPFDMNTPAAVLNNNINVDNQTMTPAVPTSTTYNNYNHTTGTVQPQHSEVVRNERKSIRRSSRLTVQSSVEKKPKAARIDWTGRHDNECKLQFPSLSQNNTDKHTQNSTPIQTPVQKLDVNTVHTPYNGPNTTDYTRHNQTHHNDADTDVNTDNYNVQLHVSARLTNVFQCLCETYRLLSMYQCKGVITMIKQHIGTVHPAHYNTGIVQTWLGRAYLELADYKHAITAYQRCHELQPDRLSGLEYYSTALWHMKNEVELSYLAQECVSFDRYAYQSWIILGNCYSLQKDHETALKYFKRAQQLNSQCAYAYTLSAHEYVATEEYDKAITDYRHAISIDARHYNAWYGIGVIYNRQEQWSNAIYHFKHAITINRSSSVLYCYLGMSYIGRQQYDAALQMFTAAEQYDPYNPMPQYQRATVYVRLHRYNDALTQLNKLQLLAPKEASIYHLQGQIYKQQHQSSDALMCWIHAMDCDVKDRLQIKHLIDKLHNNNNDTTVNNTDTTHTEL